MAHGDAHDHFTRGGGLGMWPVDALRANDLHQAVAEVFPVAFAKNVTRSRQQRFTGASSFAYGIEADDAQLRSAAKAVYIGRGNFVCIRRPTPAASAHPHPLCSFLPHSHVAEVADDVGQNVGYGLADLV